MKQTGNMKLYSFEEVKDELLGKPGTQDRDEHERNVAEALHAYRIGEAIKKARVSKNLTQEQLGERVGVKRAQICKLERGSCSITLSSMERVFRALGITTATLDLGIGGKIALW